MKNENLNCLIDLGSNKIKCALFSQEGDQPNLIAFSEKETKGIHNSIIVNFNDAANTIRSVVSDIEKQSGLNLSKISILFEPIETIVTHLTKFKNMEGTKIEKEDINFLLREAKKEIEKNDKNMTQIHMFNSKYIVDNKVFHDIPINIFCDKLSLENTFISIPKNILKNISEVLHNCELEIDRFISTSYANGLNLFDRYKLEQSCGIIDIGYEKTSIALFKNFSFYKLAVIPIGSNHITKDISKICYLSKLDSESIKLDKSLFLNSENIQNDLNKLIPKNFFTKSKFRKISIKFIEDIIISRIHEISQIVFKELKDIDNYDTINRNLIYIGEGSKIIELGKTLDMDLDMTPEKIYKNSEKNVSINQLACYSGQNLLVKGWSKEAIATNYSSQKKGIFTRFFEIFN